MKKISLEFEVQSKQLETFRAIQKLILDQEKLNDTSNQSKSPNQKPEQENTTINIKQEIIAMPNMPTSTSSTSTHRKKASVFICVIPFSIKLVTLLGIICFLILLKPI